MKKNYFFICLLLIMCSLLCGFVNGSHNILSNNLSQNFVPSSILQVEWKDLTCEEKLSFLERLIMLNFVPQITEAVDVYYKGKGYDIVKITDVRVVAPYEYEAKILISTYVGAHNPPSGLDVVTIRFKYLRDGKVVNYEHIKDY